MILIFSDIHANKKAAKFVESIARGFSEIIFCGDVCGYGKDFKYCIDMFKSLKVKAVIGNHDRLVLGPMAQLRDYVDEVSVPIMWTKKHLKVKESTYLETLPESLETESGIFAIHTLYKDSYLRSEDECKPLLSKTKAKIIAIGHTHVWEEYHIGDVTVVNVGSISHGRCGTSPGYVMVDNGRIIHRNVGG